MAVMLDSSGSGLPVWWEMAFFGVTGIDASAASATPGLTIGQAFNQGVPPTVDVTGGNPTIQYSSTETPPPPPAVTAC